MTIVTRFFPNGEFSQGVDTSRSRKERATKRRHDPLADDWGTTKEECIHTYLQWKEENADIDLYEIGQSYLSRDGKKLWVYVGQDEWGNHTFDCINSKGSDTLGVQMNYPIGRLIGSGALTPLVHQSLESSSPPLSEKPSRKQLLTMTKNMARNVRNGCYLLEETYGKDNLSFLTLTLPDLSTNDLAACCERWDYMTDRILKWMKKRLNKQWIDFEYVYCTEIQTKRLHSRGEYAPHLHIVFRGRNGRKSAWAIQPKQVRKAWASVVADVVGHRDFTTDALENLQRIKKSAARYLSKYMSKGSNCIPQDTIDKPIATLKTQWGGMARSVSRAVKKTTIRISQGSSVLGEYLPALINNYQGLLDAGLIRYFKIGYIPIGRVDIYGERFLKVCSGCLSKPTYRGGLVPVIDYLMLRIETNT